MALILKEKLQKLFRILHQIIFFIGIQNTDREIFENTIKSMDEQFRLEIVPIVSSGIGKINGVDPKKYIKRDNDSYWVIGSDRRSSWSEKIPEDNPMIAGNGGIYLNLINYKYL